MNPLEDRKRTTRITQTLQTPQSGSQSSLAELASASGLHDLWRIMHPLDTEFTHFYRVHDSFAHLDYLFGTNPLLQMIKASDLHEIVISDHAPISIDLSIAPRIANTILWRFPGYLKNNEDFCHFLRSSWQEYAEINSQHVESPAFFWEEGKAYLRGRIMSYTAAYRKKTVNAFKEASAAVRLAQGRLITDSDQTSKTLWEQAKQTFDLWADRYECMKTSYMDLAFHKFGNKAGKLMARLVNGRNSPSHIFVLQDKTGSLLTDPIAINGALEEYFTSLYSKDDMDRVEAETFLSQIDLPTVLEEQSHMLNADITLGDIETVVQSLMGGKAPGPDGFTAEFFKILKGDITGTLHALYNHMWEEGAYFHTGREAYIKLLPKPGKDPTNPGSYRPISLINVDAKILSKILAGRLAEVMPHLIHPAQVGFVRGRAAVMNLRRVILALEQAKAFPVREFAMVTLDAEKAFDNVNLE